MCPMRIFLVLFSALLASYLAWRNFSKVEKTSIFDCTEEETEVVADKTKEESSSVQIFSKISSGFWTFVDMASGRYLWKNLRPQSKPVEDKQR